MQSELLSFFHRGESCKLYGDFSNLQPVYVDGIAQAVPSDNGLVLTFFSKTGLVQNGEVICSADIRIALSKENLMEIFKQISTLVEERTEKPTNDSKNEPIDDKNENLGPVLR